MGVPAQPPAPKLDRPPSIMKPAPAFTASTRSFCWFGVRNSAGRSERT